MEESARSARHLRPPDAGGSPPAEPSERLVAVLVGIDEYEKSKPLRFAVNDARTMRRTLEEAHLGKRELQVLTAGGARREGEIYPSRSAILDALARAARRARPSDVVLVYFAGHGSLIDGALQLSAADSDPRRVASLLSVRDLRGVFRDCASPHLLLFLDCCQTPGAAEGPAAEATDAPARAQWRSGMPFARDCVEALEEQMAGWTVLTSCSPGEGSWETRDEDSALAEHQGLFTHFLALGLGGQADLDDDGVVSFAELVQYVCRAVPPRVRTVHGESQHPRVIWRGPGHLPLTRVTLQRPGSGFPGLWLQRSLGRWPYREIPIGDLMRYGIGVVYGLVMLLEALLLGGAGRWGTAVLCGAASTLAWLIATGLSMAAHDRRWHTGGYFAVAVLFLWHLLLLVPAVGPGTRGPRAELHYGIDVVLILGLMVILGLNPLHIVLCLVRLVRDGDDHGLRQVLDQLRRRPFDVRQSGSLPAYVLHPRVYVQWFGIIANLFLLLVSLTVLYRASQAGPTAIDVLELTRNALLIALILWQVAAYSAAYTHVEHAYAG